MLTLYGAQRSGSAAIEAALTIAGVRFHSVKAATWEPGAGLKKLKRVNPLGQIPTLVLDDGTVMSESAAILIWLGLQHPKSGLLPAKPAEAIRGLVFIAANCYAAIGIIDYPERYCADCDEATAKRIKAGSMARLHRYWEMFADQFGSLLKPAKPGALDLLAATVSHWSGGRAHVKAHRPRLHAALERIEAHPRVASIFRRHWPAK